MGIGAALDSLIGVVAPGWAFRRATARAGLELLSSTANGRRTNFNPNPRPPRQFVPDTSMRAAGRVVERQHDRDDARQLVNTNPLARAAVNRWRTYVAGVGPEVRSKNPDAAWADLATKRFTDWAFSDGFEVRGRHIGQVLPEFVRSGKIDGDVALGLIDAGEHAGKVQLLTADRVWSASPISASDGRRVVDGVEVDELGNATAYFIRVSGFTSDFTSIRTPAESIIFHRFDWLHPDDVRGNPFASSTADKFVSADTLISATVTAASLAAKLALIIKTLNPPKYRPPSDGDAKPTTEVEDGQMVRLRAGEDIEAIQGTHPQAQVSPFLIDLIRIIGAAEGIPMELLLLHFGLGSFASTNAAFTIFATAVHEAQADLINGPLARLWRWWVDREIAAGTLTDSPGKYLHKWTLKPPSALFPADQAQAALVLRDAGRRTFVDDCEEDGVDWRERIAEIAAVDAECKAKGVKLAHSTATRPDMDPVLSSSPKPTPAPTNPPAAPAPSKEAA